MIHYYFKWTNLKYIFPQVLLGIYLIKAFLNSNSIAEFEWGCKQKMDVELQFNLNFYYFIVWLLNKCKK